MAKKKFLTKNEFRMDNNPKHFGKENKPHPAWLSGRSGHKCFANGITHSRITTEGKVNHEISENPDKTVNTEKDKRPVRITDPYWQSDKLFGKEKLNNFRFSKKTKAEIKKINKKSIKKFDPCGVSTNSSAQKGLVESNKILTPKKSNVKNKKAQKNSTRAALPPFNCQHKVGSVEFHDNVTKTKANVKTKRQGGKK